LIIRLLNEIRRYLHYIQPIQKVKNLKGKKYREPSLFTRVLASRILT